MGPVGSGKTVAGEWELLLRAFAMPPCHDGVRRSRYACIRNTYGDLERTTINTWKDLFSEEFGSPVTRKSGIVHEIRRGLGDGTAINLDVYFFSLDRPQDVKKLLSFELSGAFVNEGREIPKQIYDALDDRVTRYPAKGMLPDGVIPWFGWWADTNAPDTDSWIYKTFETDKPDDWTMFRQPGGVIWNGHKWVINPEAENLHNLTLGARYYTEALPGKSEDHIRVYYANEYGYVKEGRLIVGDFNEHLHIAKLPIEFEPDIELIYLGFDFGATPAAVMEQQMPNGQWRWVEEFQAEKTGIRPLVEDCVRPRMQSLIHQGHKFVITGDPAGASTDQGDGRTPFKVMKDLGLDCGAAYTNAFEHRSEILRRACRTIVDGQPKLLISPNCAIAKRGLAQKYVYKKVGVQTDEGQKYQTVPDKNEFSHVIEAGTYGMMGAGEGRDLGKGGQKKGKLNYSKLTEKANMMELNQSTPRVEPANWALKMKESTGFLPVGRTFDGALVISAHEVMSRMGPLTDEMRTHILSHNPIGIREGGSFCDFPRDEIDCKAAGWSYPSALVHREERPITDDDMMFFFEE